MTSRFEIAEEEYIEKLKDKSDNENTKNNKNGVLEKIVQNMGERKKSSSKFRIVRERWPNTVAVLCIQKFSNFPLYVIYN